MLATALMVIDHRFHYLHIVRNAFSTVLTPLYYLANLPDDMLGWADTNIISRSDLQRENQRLKDEQLILKAQIQRLVALESENARLRALMGAARDQEGKRLVAEVLSVGIAPYTREILINKGELDGVYAGQAVVDADGVMGQVRETSSLSSRVLLITDVNHGMPVRVNRNGLRAIAQGSGDSDELRLAYIPNTADIRAGDLLVSSGLGQKFPDGFPVAVVSEVRRDPGQPYAFISALPSARLATADHVLLIWPDPDTQPFAEPASPNGLEQVQP